jgi:outer membrane lipoprotein-sorting protein
VLKLNMVLALAIALPAVHAMTAGEALDGMEKTWNGLTCYSCRMQVTSHRGRESMRQGFLYQFRKPRLARLKVTTAPNKGADVVYDRNGKIHAGKRVLGIRFKKAMDLSDPEFYDLRGVPFWKADLGSQVVDLRRKLALPGATGSASSGTWDAQAVLILTLRYRERGVQPPSGEHDYVDLWTLDKVTKFPMHRTLTEDGALVEEVTASAIDLNASLPESHFRL